VYVGIAGLIEGQVECGMPAIGGNEEPARGPVEPLEHASIAIPHGHQDKFHVAIAGRSNASLMGDDELSVGRPRFRFDPVGFGFGDQRPLTRPVATNDPDLVLYPVAAGEVCPLISDLGSVRREHRRPGGVEGVTPGVSVGDPCEGFGL
jgi:hypothetical protein